MQSLIEYINRSRLQGYADNVIKQNLITAGWDINHIEEAYDALNMKRSSSIFTKKLLVATMFTGFIIALGLFLVFSYRKNLSTNMHSDIKPTPKSYTAQKLPHTTIVFISNDNNRHIVFYDIARQKKLPDFPEFTQPTNSPIISLGSWSPNGELLPIIVTDVETESRNNEYRIFFYHAVNHTLQKVYDTRIDPDKNDGLIGFSWYTSAWINNTKFAYRISSIDNTLWVNTKGERGNDAALFNFDQGSDYTVRIIDGVNDTRTYLVEAKGYTVTVPYDNVSILGIVDEAVLTMRFPQIGNVGNPSLPNYIDTKPLTEKLKQEGKTDEEIGQAIFDLAEPKENARLQMIDLKSGRIISDYEIDRSDGLVETVLLLADKKTLLMHTTNKFFFPTNTSYFKTRLDKLTDMTRLESLDIDPRHNGWTRETGRSFDYVDLDNNIILITYLGNRNKSDLGSGLQLHYLNSNKKTIICEQNCYDFKIYNPNYEYHTEKLSM